MVVECKAFIFFLFIAISFSILQDKIVWLNHVWLFKEIGYFVYIYATIIVYFLNLNLFSVSVQVKDSVYEFQNYILRNSSKKL